MRLFGTDGIRDRAHEGRLAEAVVVRLGLALARFARAACGGSRPRVALGRDPRPSGPALVEQLSRGLVAAGAAVVDLGVVPTPAVAFATAAWGHDLGVMVSASHNPEADNGLKPFLRGGRKLSTQEEAAVEALVDGVGAGSAPGTPAVPGIPPAPADPVEREQGAARYASQTLELLADGGRGALRGLRLVVDLAAGATGATAPAVLSGLGVEAELLHPPGSRPINDRCGSEHPAAWLAAVRARGADAGLAFDGDGDRVLVADASGALLDGDDLLAILAEDLARAGRLPGGRVVATVMSNLGLDERLAELGVRVERVDVGDRNVAERMRALGAPLGGEASGHVVLERPVGAAAPALVGDALVAGVRVLQAARRLGSSLAELRARRPRYPQVLRNLPLRERRELASLPRLRAEVEAVEAAFAGRGRVLVRPSGTEPLLRIMVEHREQAALEAALERLLGVARAELG